MKTKIFKKEIKSQSGQVVLMVLLASALILTLGLSASKQATVETKIDTDQELLKKAFNAAESGIEYYLGTGNKSYSAPDINVSADISVKYIGNSQELSFGSMTLNGESEYFWLVDHNEDGTMGTNFYSTQNPGVNICTVDGENADFKVSYFYKTKIGGEYQVKNSNVTTTNGCYSYNFSTGEESLLLNVTPIGSSHIIKLTGNEVFPVQGEEISSTGKVSEVNNTVTVLNKYTIPPFLFEAVSSGDYVTN